RSCRSSITRQSSSSGITKRLCTRRSKSDHMGLVHRIPSPRDGEGQAGGEDGGRSKSLVKPEEDRDLHSTAPSRASLLPSHRALCSGRHAPNALIAAG